MGRIEPTMMKVGWEDVLSRRQWTCSLGGSSGVVLGSGRNSFRKKTALGW